MNYHPGLLADSEQAHVIGTYEYVSEGPDGRLNYRQNENWQKYLYYYTGFGINVSTTMFENGLESTWTQFKEWYIGDAPGANAFYAYCEDNALCPEDLGPYWKYYAFNTGETIQDPDVTVTCV